MIINEEWLNSNETRWYPLQVVETETIFPKNLLLDAVIVAPTATSSLNDEDVPLEYGINKVEIDFTTNEVVYHIREFLLDNASVYKDIGQFRIPRVRHSILTVDLLALEDNYNGRFTVNAGSNLQTATSVIDFEKVVFESCRCLPAPIFGMHVDTVGTQNLSLVEDVYLRDDWENGGGIAVDTFTNVFNESIIELEYSETNECPFDTIEDCTPHNSLLCYGYLKTINEVPPNHNFNITLTGRAPIQISTLPTKKPGTYGINPEDYEVTSLIIHYYGHIMESIAGDGSRKVGLMCKWMPKADTTGIQSVLDSLVGNV